MMEPESEPVFSPAPEDADLQQLQDLLKNQEMDGGEVEISRKRPMDRGFNYLDKLPVAQFSLEDVKRQYGGGEYRCKLKRASGQFFKSITFSIDMMFKGAMETASAAPAYNGGNGNAADVEKIVTALTSRPGGNDNMQFMLAMMDQNSKMQMAMLQSMTSVLVAAMGKKDSGSQQDFTPVIIEMLKTSRPDAIGELSKLIRLSRDLGADGKPAAESGGIMDKLLEMAGPLVMGLLAKGQQPIIQTMPNITPMPAPAPVSPAPAPAESNNMKSLFVSQLLNAAKSNADVMEWADTIDQMIPEAQRAALLQVLARDDWMALIFESRLNEAMLYRTWFDSLRNEMLHPSLEPEVNPAPQP